MSFAGNVPSNPPQGARTRVGSALSNALGSALGGAFGGGGRRGGSAVGAGSSTTGTATSARGPARRRDRAAAGLNDDLAPSARRGSPSTGSDTDWARVGAFGAGIALGALLGAGAALLYAPQSGIATRAVLRKKARRVTTRATDAWDELGNELRGAARRGQRTVRRGVTRGRWAAADFFDE